MAVAVPRFDLHTRPMLFQRCNAVRCYTRLEQAQAEELGKNAQTRQSGVCEALTTQRKLLEFGHAGQDGYTPITEVMAKEIDVFQPGKIFQAGKTCIGDARFCVRWPSKQPLAVKT